MARKRVPLAEKSRRMFLKAKAQQAESQAEIERVKAQKRKELEKRIKNEDVPKYFQRCLSQIQEAAKKGKCEVMVELGTFRGKWENPNQYLWSFACGELAALLTAEDYKVHQMWHYEEVSVEDGRGDETEVRIVITW